MEGSPKFQVFVFVGEPQKNGNLGIRETSGSMPSTDGSSSKKWDHLMVFGRLWKTKLGRWFVVIFTYQPRKKDHIHRNCLKLRRPSQQRIWVFCMSYIYIYIYFYYVLYKLYITYYTYLMPISLRRRDNWFPATLILAKLISRVPCGPTCFLEVNRLGLAIESPFLETDAVELRNQVVGTVWSFFVGKNPSKIKDLPSQNGWLNIMVKTLLKWGDLGGKIPIFGNIHIINLLFHYGKLT